MQGLHSAGILDPGIVVPPLTLAVILFPCLEIQLVMSVDRLADWNLEPGMPVPCYPSSQESSTAMTQFVLMWWDSDIFCAAMSSAGACYSLAAAIVFRTEAAAGGEVISICRYVYWFVITHRLYQCNIEPLRNAGLFGNSGGLRNLRGGCSLPGLRLPSLPAACAWIV